jgi:hypothetical protein
MKQMQAMMGKYLSEISEIKNKIKDLDGRIKWLEENELVRIESQGRNYAE